MQLSPNFTLAELTISQTAARNNLNNIPKGIILDNLKFTAQQLELVRTLLNAPIIPSSGYRSPEVNALVGSSSRSQHITGEAVDFTAPKFGNPSQIVQKIKDSSIPYDQVILEFNTWVHISFKKVKNRKQALVIDSDGTRIFS